jgi:hypothetical protein
MSSLSSRGLIKNSTLLTYECRYLSGVFLGISGMTEEGGCEEGSVPVFVDGRSVG